jgi:iron(III) transport system substrate-binding protein
MEAGHGDLAALGDGLAIVSVLGLAWPGVARAQSDKQVVIYSANESTLNGLVFSAFEKETGIKVQPVAAGSGVLVKRIVCDPRDHHGRL